MPAPTMARMRAYSAAAAPLSSCQRPFRKLRIVLLHSFVGSLTRLPTFLGGPGRASLGAVTACRLQRATCPAPIEAKSYQMPRAGNVTPPGAEPTPARRLLPVTPPSRYTLQSVV